MEIRFNAARRSDRGKPARAAGDLLSPDANELGVTAKFSGDNVEDIFDRTGHVPGFGNAPTSLVQTQYEGQIHLSLSEVCELFEAVVSARIESPELRRVIGAMVAEVRGRG